MARIDLATIPTRQEWLTELRKRIGPLHPKVRHITVSYETAEQIERALEMAAELDGKVSAHKPGTDTGWFGSIADALDHAGPIAALEPLIERPDHPDRTPKTPTDPTEHELREHLAYTMSQKISGEQTPKTAEEIMTEKESRADAICDDCDHVWTVAHLPMEVGDFGKLAAGARCPKCASIRAMVKCGENTPPTPQSLGPIVDQIANAKRDQGSKTSAKDAKLKVRTAMSLAMLDNLFVTEDGQIGGEQAALKAGLRALQGVAEEQAP